MNVTNNLTPRQIGELIEDLREELEEIRLEVNLLDSRLKQGELSQDECNKEKSRLNTYMKQIIARVTDLQKQISKKDRDLAREIRQLHKTFQIDDLGEDKFNIYLYASADHFYVIEFSLSNYPKCPDILWPAKIYDDLGDPTSFLKPIRDWDPEYPSPVVEIFQALEHYAWSYFNAVRELRNELREIEGEFQLIMLRDNYIRVALMTFDKEEYPVEIDLENYPLLKWVFPPKTKHLLGNETEFLEKHDKGEKNPRIVEVLRMISWEIDKNVKLAFEMKVLLNSASDSIGEFEYNPDNKILQGVIRGELKTKAIRFEFIADFSKNYPEDPPKISLKPAAALDQDVLEKIRKYIDDVSTKWTPTTIFLDLLNSIHVAIFKSSVVTCVICHKLFCPKCDNPLFLPKGIEGKTCHVDCSSCHRPYHYHCFNDTISMMGKCAVCMKSFIAQATEDGQSSLDLDL